MLSSQAQEQERALAEQLQQAWERDRKLAEQLEKTREEAELLRSQIRNIEASKFWKIHKNWLRLKRAVGIGGKR